MYNPVFRTTGICFYNWRVSGPACKRLTIKIAQTATNISPPNQRVPDLFESSAQAHCPRQTDLPFATASVQLEQDHCGEPIR